MHLITQREKRVLDQVIALTSLVRCWTSIIMCTLEDSRFGLHITGKSRRLFLVHFRKRYVHRQLSARQGTCRQCGTCCNLLFTCPMLMKEGRCLVYGRYRPQACKVFPIDQRDIDEVKLCGAQCGYYFNTACFKNVSKEKGG